MTETSPDATTAFLDGGGEAARMIRARDWSGHPLGPPEGWPDGLRTALSLVLNSPESMILCWGPALHFFFNETYFPLLGPRLDSAMGERMDVVWADAWDQARPIVDAAFAGRSARYHDLPWKLATDRGQADTWWSFSYSRVLDRDGGIAGLFIFTNETTERLLSDRRREAAEVALRAERERVQLALAAGAIIGTWVWDLPADEFTVDEQFAKNFGLQPEMGRVGLSLEQVIATVHPDDREGLIAAIGAAIARGGAYAHQYRVKRTDGRFYWIEANGRVDHAPDGTPLRFPGVLLDVEERRLMAAERDRALAELRLLNERLEQRVTERTAELMQAEAALRQSQKMEAVGQLTGGIAHDFNNMLAVVIGSLDLAGRRLGEADGRLRRYIDAAAEGARRAASLTQRLLAFSRQQPLRPETIDLPRLVGGMSDLIRHSLGADIALDTWLPDDLWRAHTDPNQLENAILNLAVNARDAMPTGGRLTIEAHNATLDEAYVAAHAGATAGDHVRIAIADTGIGMTAEVIAKAFDPFFTTKEVGRGTGLGLSQVYGFVKQSGGHVRIESGPDRGTTVNLYLPRLAGDATRGADRAAHPALLPAAQDELILVVEDEAAVRRFSTDALRELGYRVLEADGAAAALDVLERHPGIDLLFTDVVMPGVNGRKLADEARRRRPGLKVLFTTGYTRDAMADEDGDGAGVALIGKPYSIVQLAAKVRDTLAA